MRRPRLPAPTAPPGLLSLVGLAWLATLLTAGIWVLVGLGLALVTAAVVGCVAWVLADAVLDDGTAVQGGRR